MKSLVGIWLLGPLVSLVTFTVILELGNREARQSHYPVWEDPGLFWLWAASPGCVWSLLCFFYRKNTYSSLFITTLAVISNIFGCSLVWHDANLAPVSGGMNPFSSNSIAFTIVFAAVLQWVVLILTLGILGIGLSIWAEVFRKKGE